MSFQDRRFKDIGGKGLYLRAKIEDDRLGRQDRHLRSHSMKRHADVPAGGLLLDNLSPRAKGPPRCLFAPTLSRWIQLAQGPLWWGTFQPLRAARSSCTSDPPEGSSTIPGRQRANPSFEKS